MALRRALISTVLTAFAFGTFLSFLLSWGVSQDIGMLRTVERAGIDLGQRLYAVFGQAPLAGALGRRITVIDIDEQGCIAFASERDCRFDYIGREAILERVVAAAAAQGASAVVLDFVLPDMAEAAALDFDLRAASANPDMPILVPIAPRPTGIGKTFVWADTHCGRQRCGMVEYLPATAVLADGKTRFYATRTRLRTIARRGGGAEQPPSDTTLPTIAWRAAGLLNPDLAQPVREPAPIRYTMPSAALADGGMREVARERLNYLRLSQFDPDEPLRWEGAPGQLVIIGSSAASGADLHETPLGPMAGMEVLANAILSFAEAEEAAEEQLGFGEIWWRKLEAVLQAMLFLALAEGALLMLADRRAAAQARGRTTVEGGALWDRYSWGMLGAMLFFFAAEIWLTVESIGAQLADPAISTYEIDVVWPIVGVSLGATIGFAGKVTGKIEWLVERAIDTLTTLWARFGRPGG